MMNPPGTVIIEVSDPSTNFKASERFGRRPNDQRPNWISIRWASIRSSEHAEPQFPRTGPNPKIYIFDVPEDLNPKKLRLFRAYMITQGDNTRWRFVEDLSDQLPPEQPLESDGTALVQAVKERLEQQAKILWPDRPSRPYRPKPPYYRMPRRPF